jgi:hypothetical protein
VAQGQGARCRILEQLIAGALKNAGYDHAGAKESLPRLTVAPAGGAVGAVIGNGTGRG